MLGYTINPQMIDHHLKSYKGPGRVIMIDLKELKVRMPDLSIIKLEETPHFQYMKGNQQPYKDFLRRWFQPHEYESSLASIEYLLIDDHYYLEGKHHEDYIRVDGTATIIDGVHRATRLFHLGVKEVPIVILI